MYNFIEVLSDVVKAGHNFIISGVSSSDAENLTILFSSGAEKSAAAVLAIDLNFSSNKITINKDVENDVALDRGSKFELNIRVDSDSFQINCNDVAVCEYKWHLSPDKIRSIIIFGDVDKLLKVNHLDADYPKIASSDENLAFESYIPVKYQPGHVIAISGKCSQEFFLMFTKNDTNRQLIHFNIRFDEETVVMNTEDDIDCWTENEIRSAEFPFEIEKPFKIAFGFTEENLKVAVNGSSLMEFNLDNILVEEDETVWDILSGFRIKNREEETSTMIVGIEHYRMDNNCDGFEKHSSME